ncbi:MAG: DUF4184 family protein [bacterium]
MPFTTSHPALVLPLKMMWPSRFSLTGLMAGAMAPDLLYFLLADTSERGFSHSWSGLVVFCIPAGVLFGLVFHRLFKYHAITNLPWFLQRPLSGLADSDFSLPRAADWITYVGSVMIGVLSHFAWDSFTHPWGEMAQMIPSLQRPVAVLGLSRPVCRWLQHLSTLWGGLAVLWFLMKSTHMPRPTRQQPRRGLLAKTAFWIGGLITAWACGASMIWLYNDLYGWHLGRGENYQAALTTFGLASWAGFFYFVCTYTLLNRLLRRKMTRRQRVDQPQ